MPRQERAERTRVAILDAAAAEFDEHGYEGARLERIVERTGATKGAVYFHFRSKLDIARALVDEKYANWPAIVAEVTGSGLGGLDAAQELTHRVAAVLVGDVHVRAGMKLSRAVLPATPENDPYSRWIDTISGLLRREVEGRGLAAVDPVEVATVVVHAVFGAYLIADELGRLDRLQEDVDRVWRVLDPIFRSPS